MKYIFFSILFVLFINTCRSVSGDSKEISVIEMEKFIDGDKPSISLHQISTTIREIPLETTKESLVYPGGRMGYLDNTFYLLGQQKIQVFNEQGKYVGEFIETKENGYVSLENCFVYNDEIYLLATFQQKLYVYNKDGKVTKVIEVPERIEYIHITSEENFVGYMPNYSGTQCYQYILFDQKGVLLETIPYPDKKEKELTIITVLSEEAQFYRLNDRLYMKELLNDTIYSVDHFPPSPHYIIHMGKYKAIADSRDKMTHIQDDLYKTMKPIWAKGETNRYIFFQLGKRPIINVVYDKQNDTIYQLENPGNYKILNFDLFFEKGSYFFIMQVAPEDDDFFDENPILLIATLKE